MKVIGLHSLFQINNFVSSALIGDSNATISTLTYSPKPEDHGKLLSCQAFVEGIPGSTVEDSRRLHILCKSALCNYPYLT